MEVVGRDDESETLADWLATGDRLVTLTGPPGAGKTLLARSVARDLHERNIFEAGVWYCSLREARTREDCIADVGRVLPIDFSQTTDLEESLELLVEWLEGRKLLLMLDDVEHVMDTLGELLEVSYSRVDDVRVLIVSREAVRYEPMRVHLLEPLSTEDAVALYLRVARRSPEDIEALERERVRELVDRLDRIPLAVEVAAAQLPVLGPSDILDGVDEHLDLLRQQSRDSGEWESPLRDAIAWSWTHLEEWQRELLSQCALFNGAFSLRAARSVVSLDEFDRAPPVSQALNSVVQKSLVRLHDAKPQLRVFALYKSVAEFARSMRDDVETDVHDRFVAYYIERVQQLVESIDTEESLLAQEEFEFAYADLDAAFEHAVEEDPKAAARLAEGMAKLILASSPQREIQSRIDRAMKGLERLDADDREARRLRARLFTVASRPWFRLSAPLTEEVGQNYERALALLDPEEDPVEYADAQSKYGYFLSSIGRVEEATAELQSAVELAEKIDRPRIRVEALGCNGMLPFLQGDIETARSRLGEAITLADDAGLQFYRCVGNNALALYEASCGRFGAAAAHAEEALRLAEELELSVQKVVALNGLGQYRLALGEFDVAEEHLKQGLEFAEESGIRSRRDELASNLGLIDMLNGDFEGAALHFDRAVGLARAFKRPEIETQAFLRLGALDLVQDNPGAGRECLDGARRVADKTGSRRADQLVEIGSKYLRIGEAVEASESGESERARALLAAIDTSVSGADSDVDALSPSKNARVHLEARVLEFTIVMVCREYGLLEVDDESTESIQIGPGARWFEFPGEERVDIARRTALRRILEHLVATYCEDPGGGSDVFELLDVGWPDEDLLPESGKARVYTAVATLRDFGFEGVLLTGNGGYFLDPEAAVTVHELETSG